MTANYNEPVYNERTLHKINKNTIILDEWYSDVVKLIEKLESKESETCVAAGFLEEINKLPESLPWAQLLTQDSFISQIQNQDITLTSKINAEAARYRTVLNSIKIDLKRIMETQEQKNTQVVNSNL